MERQLKYVWAWVVAAGVAALVGCTTDTPTQYSENPTLPAAKDVAGAQAKVDICHMDGAGLWHLIHIAQPAVRAHLAHGDVLAGGDVLDANCEPVEPGPITVPLPGGATMDFVWISPGAFMMGALTSESDRYDDEAPPHPVTLTQGFWLGTCEVTQGQWEAVMGSTPWIGESYVQPAATNPAVYISWDNAQAFVSNLNQAAGGNLYRLPTEAEWEYACRAGTNTKWSFGDDETGACQDSCRLG